MKSLATLFLSELVLTDIENEPDDAMSLNRVPSGASRLGTLHAIAATDDGVPAFTRYRRVITDVAGSAE